MIWITMVRL